MLIGIIITAFLITGMFIYAFICGASNYSPEVRRALDDEQMAEIAKQKNIKKYK